MKIKARSIVAITSIHALQNKQASIMNFFDKIPVIQKDLIIYSPKPIMDYTTIKKIATRQIIMIYQKDFWPLNIALKPFVQNTLRKKQYDILIHYNNDNTAQNTYLISKSISAPIKISNIFPNKKLFSIIIQSEIMFFEEVMKYVQKIIW